MSADVIPFPARKPNEADAHAALERFIHVSMTLLPAHGVTSPADLPEPYRQHIEELAADVVRLLDELGPVLPGVEVVDGQLTFVVPA